MNRAVRRLLVPLAVVAALVASTPGAAAADGPRSSKPGILRIQTVPPIGGVKVSVDGNTGRTDANGRLNIRVRNFLGLQSRLTIAATTVAPDRRVVFDRFRGSPDHGVRRVVEVGLRTIRRVSWSFVDRFGEPVPAERITVMRLRSSTGEIHEIRGEELKQPLWVAESRTQQGPLGLASKQLYHVVDSAVVDGTSVVNRAAQRFVPGERQDWTIQLLFFKVSFTASDMLFSRGAGAGVVLTRADGRVQRLRFGPDGTVLVPDLPRGTYEVRVTGGGLSFARPVSISRDQQVMLSVISPLDLSLVLLGLLAAAVGLILVGRPHLWRRLLRRGEPGRVRAGSRRRRLPWPGRRPDPTTAPAILDLDDTAPLAVPDPRAEAPAAGEPTDPGQPDDERIAGRRGATVGIVALLALLVVVPVAERPAAADPHRAAVPQVATGPAPAPVPSAVPVLAYYYIWFNPTSWNRAKIDYPTLGRYSSDDTEIMRRHVRMAKAAGINGFLVSWKRTPQLDARLDALVEVARREDFRLGIVYQGLDFARKPLPLATVRADLGHVAQKYATEPVFDILGRPVVVWTGAEQFTAEQIDDTVGAARRKLLVLGNAKNVDTVVATRGVLDGQAYYWSSADPLKEKSAEKLAAMSEAVKAGGGIWIPPVAPGFDARMIGGRREVDRRDGETLRASFAAARRSGHDALGVISWNEFSENTHIEPSERHGERYLTVLADLLGLRVDHDVLMESHATPDPEPWGPPAWAALLSTGAAAALLPLWLVYRRRRTRSADTAPPTQRGAAPQVNHVDL